MRLIDADELRNRYEIISDPNGWFNREQTTWMEAAKTFADMVDDAPTIDAAPVRRGEWKYEKIGGKTYCFCSECGDQPMRFEPNFCPNCGADMRI